MDLIKRLNLPKLIIKQQMINKTYNGNDNKINLKKQHGFRKISERSFQQCVAKQLVYNSIGDRNERKGDN